MIKHIVMWSLKEEALGNTKIENGLKIKEMLETLKNELDEIIEMEVGINFCAAEQAYDVVLYSTFKTKEDLIAYQVDPKHVAIGDFVKQVVINKSVVDYEK